MRRLEDVSYHALKLRLAARRLRIDLLAEIVPAAAPRLPVRACADTRTGTRWLECAGTAAAAQLGRSGA